MDRLFSSESLNEPLLRRIVAPITRSRRLGLLTERVFWWLWIRTGGWKAGPDRTEEIDVTARLSPRCEVIARRENGSVVVEIRKRDMRGAARENARQGN